MSTSRNRPHLCPLDGHWCDWCGDSCKEFVRTPTRAERLARHLKGTTAPPADTPDRGLLVPQLKRAS